MSYAAIMVYVDAEGASEQRLRLAISISEKFNSTLIGISARAVSPPIGSEQFVTPDLIEAETKEIKAALSERENWFRKIASAAHHRLEWRSAVDLPTQTLAREARAADLLVVGRSKEAGNIYSAPDLGGAILNAGRPVLFVPDGIGALRARHVVIGWKDTREARRAVSDALPFLHEADTVAIVEIHEPNETLAAQQRIDDVANFLGRHRVKAGPKITLQRRGSDAGQLLRVAQDAGADLLVTGAYGHSRLGEWFFGGVTRELLASSPMCCLM
ncbi:MAG TPA: universal stress protein, partial [Terriglobales bacterium]|nr:universal stress protein [Terriglobales bacterium]